MNLDIALDPVYATMRSECHMVKHIFDTLVYINEERTAIEPGLAFHWEYNDEEKIWTFYLRKGVHFHNGKRLTAHDVYIFIESIYDGCRQPARMDVTACGKFSCSR